MSVYVGVVYTYAYVNARRAGCVLVLTYLLTYSLTSPWGWGCDGDKTREEKSGSRPTWRAIGSQSVINPIKRRACSSSLVGYLPSCACSVVSSRAKSKRSQWRRQKEEERERARTFFCAAVFFGRHLQQSKKETNRKSDSNALRALLLLAFVCCCVCFAIATAIATSHSSPFLLPLRPVRAGCSPVNANAVRTTNTPPRLPIYTTRSPYPPTKKHNTTHAWIVHFPIPQLPQSRASAAYRSVKRRLPTLLSVAYPVDCRC